MTIYVVGNPLVPSDSAPIMYLDAIQKAFPHIPCTEADPNENFLPEDGSIIVDTVKGIDRVTEFDSLDVFAHTNHVSVHDYDLLMHLLLVQKIGKLRTIHILGVPIGVSLQALIEGIERILSNEPKHEGQN